ncbi:MAG: MFS transporter, partial [Bacillota bacterium]
LRANQISQFIALVGIPLGVGLASIRLNIPYLAGGVFYLFLGCFLILTMKETSFHPIRRDHKPFSAMARTVTQSLTMVRSHPILLLMIGAGLFAGASSEGFDRLWQAYFLQDFAFPKIGQLQPVVWFGLISAVRSILSIVLTQTMQQRVDTGSRRSVVSVLKLLTVIRVGCLSAFALSGSFVWALVSYLGVSVVATLIEPLFETWVNQNVDRHVRATVLSMMGQADALGQTAGGPAVGFAATRFSLRLSMLMVAALLVPSLRVYSSAIKQHMEADGNEDLGISTGM